MTAPLPWPEYEKWLQGPPPAFRFRKIQAKVRSFEVKDLRERGLNDQYPHQLIHPTHPTTVWFWQLQGHGPPPVDIPVHPGDIYIDVAALPIVEVYQRNASNTGWNQFNTPSESSMEMPTTFKILPHPYIPDRCLATTKSKMLRDQAENKVNLSYFTIVNVIRRGSIPERDAIFRSNLAAMFPRNFKLEINHGTMEVESRPTGSQSNDRTTRTAAKASLPSIVIKSRAMQNEEQLQDSMERISDLEKELRGSRSRIDELETTLAQERTVSNKTENQLKFFYKNLNTKYHMVLRRLGDEQETAVGVKRKLREIHEIYTEHDARSKASRT